VSISPNVSIDILHKPLIELGYSLWGKLGATTSKNMGKIMVVFNYDSVFLEELKTIADHKWHPIERCWSFPNSKPILNKIFAAFSWHKFDIESEELIYD